MLILPPRQAETALEWFVARLHDPTRAPFGAPLARREVQLARAARARVAVDAARLVVLSAAAALDAAGDAAAMPVAAQSAVAAAKLTAPRAAHAALDAAIQAHGAAGLSQDTPLAALLAWQRALRVLDGPDEVHLLQLGRREAARGPALRARIAAQRRAALRLCHEQDVAWADPLAVPPPAADRARDGASVGAGGTERGVHGGGEGGAKSKSKL